MPANAGGTATVTFDASNDTPVRGDIITVTVVLSDCDNAASVLIEPVYDDTVLELQSGTWLLTGATLVDNWSAQFGDAAIAYMSETDINGEVFEMTFKVLDDAQIGNTTVDCNITIEKLQEVTIPANTVPILIEVSCDHTFTAETVADEYFKDAATCISKAVYYKSCSACGEKGTDTFDTGDVLGHDWSSTYSQNEQGHYRTCTRTGCGANEDPTPCSGGTATCKDRAVCTTCDQAYGELSTIHTPGAAATCQTAQICTVCDKELEAKKAHSYTGTVKDNGDGTHSFMCVNGCNQYGGAVTCTDATGDNDHACDTCGAADVTVHTPAADDGDCTTAIICSECGDITTAAAASHTPGAAATCQTAQICTVCDKELEAKKAHSYTGAVNANGDGTHSYQCVNGCSQYGGTVNCSGGTATCTEKAVCTTCDQTYGKTLDHQYTKQDTAEKYLKAEATCTSKAQYYYSCVDCGAKGTTFFEAGETAPHKFTVPQYDADNHWNKCQDCTATDTKKTHSGGTATCTEKAVCATCNQPYGKTLDHKYTKQDTAEKYLKAEATCTSKAQYYYSCVDCGAKGTTFFEAGETAPHKFTVPQYDADNHWNKCQDCTATDTKKAHSGGTATCTEKAVCTTCNQPYGNTLDHKYTVLQYDADNHWNKCQECEESCWTEETAKRRITQVITMNDSYSLILCQR